MLELRDDKLTTLEFQLELHGNEHPPQARLVLAMSKNVQLMMTAEVADGLVTVSIPPLGKLLKAAVGGAVSLEVIVDDNYYIPWTGEVVLREGIKVGVLGSPVVRSQDDSRLRVTASAPVLRDANRRVVMGRERNRVEADPIKREMLREGGGNSVWDGLE